MVYQNDVNRQMLTEAIKEKSKSRIRTDSHEAGKNKSYYSGAKAAFKAKTLHLDDLQNGL